MSLLSRTRILLLVVIGIALLVSVSLGSKYVAKTIPIIWLSILGLIMVLVPLIAIIAYRIAAKRGSNLYKHDRIRMVAGLILLSNFFLVHATKDHALVELSDRFNIGYETNLGRYEDRYLDEEYVYIEYRSTNRILDLLLNNIEMIILVSGLVGWWVIYTPHPSRQFLRRLEHTAQKIQKD